MRQCKKVGAASYDIEWYRLPRNVSLGLILLIAISNYPPKITAGKLFDLSLLTFSSVSIRTSLLLIENTYTMVSILFFYPSMNFRYLRHPSFISTWFERWQIKWKISNRHTILSHGLLFNIIFIKFVLILW